MKKIIEGKIYNTETANEIDTYYSGHPSGDFNRYEETLHKTKKGSYFLSGFGNAMSKYSESCGGNSWSGGSDIIALSEAEAMEWMEEYGDADIMVREFSHALVEA